MNNIRVDGQSICPSKIVCIGRNYVAHIEELGNEVPDEMVVFIKPNSAISNSLMATHDSEALHYEGEIAFMVRSGKLAAVGFGLDLTKRGLQSKLKEKGLPWERAKAFDGAAVLSEFVSYQGDGSDLSLELLIDGEVRQRGGVELMMYPPTTILDELSRFMSLEDGDVIMTGTPAGVGPVTAETAFQGRVIQRGSALVEALWPAK